MGQTTRAPAFRVVTRQDFSDVAHRLEVEHPLLVRAAQPASSSSPRNTVTANAFA